MFKENKMSTKLLRISLSALALSGSLHVNADQGSSDEHAKSLPAYPIEQTPPVLRLPPAAI
jgi:hypothetical protein